MEKKAWMFFLRIGIFREFQKKKKDAKKLPPEKSQFLGGSFEPRPGDGVGGNKIIERAIGSISKKTVPEKSAGQTTRLPATAVRNLPDVQQRAGN